MHCHFFLQITQLMPLTNKLSKNGNVLNPKNKNQSIQHCFCHIKSNNHQSAFVTKTWRKASARSLLINIVFKFRLVIVLIALLTVVYSIVSKTLIILSLTDFLNEWNKWWIFRQLLLDLNANSKKNDDVFKNWIQMKNIIMCMLILNVFRQEFENLFGEL